MEEVFDIGNTFGSRTVSIGHSRKVWRRIDEQLPGGYHITNMSDYSNSESIEAGRPVVYDTSAGADARNVKVLTWVQVKAAITGDSAPGIDSLNIIGFTQEDVPVYSKKVNGSTVYDYGTCNIVVKGEIYGYMMGETISDSAKISAAVKTMTQKNGLSIRVID